MNILNIHLKANKFGYWVMVIGILEYIFWHEHVMERSMLDLAREGSYLGMDCCAYVMVMALQKNLRIFRFLKKGLV